MSCDFMSFFIRCFVKNEPNVIWSFSLQRVNDVCKQLTSLELSQPMGKTEFSSTAKTRRNSAS